MRVFLALGPGNLVGAVRAAMEGRSSGETSLAYSDLALDELRRRGIPTLATSYFPQADTVVDGLITAKNLPMPTGGDDGMAYHRKVWAYARMLAAEAKAFGATLAVIDSGSSHYFMLSLLHFQGARVAVNLHNVLWPEGYPPTRPIWRAIRGLNRVFFRRIAIAGMGVSPTTERQVLTEAAHRIPFFQYRAQFSPQGFAKAGPYEGGMFRVIAVGRIEENKGFVDLVEVARILREIAPVPVHIDICGDGPVRARIAELVARHDLHDHVTVHGRLARGPLLEVYAKAHALIVPTRSTFTEGMPHVCAEAVLTGLPIVAPQVANAYDVVGDAIVRAQTDNPRSYAEAIVRLITEPGLLDRLRAACAPASRQFVDRKEGVDVALARLLEHVRRTPA
jgi:glycogen(starch) synthase